MLKFLGAFDAVEVNVGEGKPAAILMDQHEGWAGDLFLGGAKPFGHTTDQQCFPGAQVPLQGENLAAGQL